MNGGNVPVEDELFLIPFFVNFIKTVPVLL
jgi:hypothetical protein